MKKVRKCPECKLYNNKRKEYCERCGCRIDGLPVIEVDDDLTEEPDSGLVVQPQEDGQSILLTEQNKKYKCKHCGTEYSILRPDSLQYCDICDRLVYDPLKGERDCEEAAPPASDGETDKTYIVPQCKNLRFVSTAGKGSFCLAFEAEPKSFGRSTCAIEFIRGNNYISRAHISYFLKDRDTSVVDTSANGTYINGIKLVNGEAYPLKDGDKIRFYNEEFIVENGN